MAAAEKMQHAVVKCILPGDVALKSIGPSMDRPAERKQMVMLAEINHRAHVERGPDIRKVSFIRRLMIDLHAHEHIGQNLLLQHRPDKPPVVVPETEFKP